jgi:adenosylcobyric acid synthase
MSPRPRLGSGQIQGQAPVIHHSSTTVPSGYAAIDGCRTLSPVKGALLVAGTSSDAGKSVLVAGLCRWLARQGVRVAPFKAQNMALNSAVTADGAEIGRAQAMQAAAAGVDPEAAMNPVLLKPGSDTRSQVVLLGKPVAEAGALDYQELKPALEEAVAASLADLRRRFDVVICEGAGSPAEINLRHRDIANMGLARAADLPVIVVGDIDRGGLLAALYGTLAVLEAADQRHIAGFVVNKFRGDLRLLAPGLDMLQSMTGRPTLGVLPWRKDLWLDAEDSLDLDSRPRAALPPHGSSHWSSHGAGSLRIVVVRLPRMSNVTDVDPLAAEPGVIVDLATTPAQLNEADLVILPGTRATVSDLGWLRETGLAAAVADRAARGRPVFGICGGYQMLARSIHDDVESGAGTVPGLGLLPATVKFTAAKTLARPSGSALGEPVAGYEIHHGTVTPDGGEPFLDGCEAGAVRGTTWHGIFENDAFRRAFLRDLAARTGRDFTPAPDISFAAVREQRYDILANMIDAYLDTGALSALIEGGVPVGLPAVVSGLALP